MPAEPAWALKFITLVFSHTDIVGAEIRSGEPLCWSIEWDDIEDEWQFTVFPAVFLNNDGERHYLGWCVDLMPVLESFDAALKPEVGCSPHGVNIFGQYSGEDTTLILMWEPPDGVPPTGKLNLDGSITFFEQDVPTETLPN